MARYKTCVLCGKSILPTESCVPYKGRYAHDHCFKDAMKLLGQGKKKQLAASEKKKKDASKKKAQAELKDGMSEEDYAKKKHYYEYLKELLNDEQLTAKQFAVSERYIERYNFTFEGMYQTLVYLNEILEKELVGDIVGIIPYYYSEAEQFNKELRQIADNNKKINLNKLYSDKRVIKITPQKRKVKQMDVESIGGNV